MRLETSLKRRDRAISNLRDQFSSAAICGTLSADMNAAYSKMCASVLKGAPAWVRQYVDGYRRALTDKAYESELVYGGFYAGQFCSTHSKRADYYQARGIEPAAFADDGAVQARGHYWCQSIDRGTPKPFFI